MVESRPEIKFSHETGEETREAVNRYRTEMGTRSQEGAIRQLLPQWAFDGRDDSYPGLPGKPLPGLEIRGDTVQDWEFNDQVAGSGTVEGSVRVYYDAFPESGFDFCAVLVEAIMDQHEPFIDENTRVSVLVYGRAEWDGIHNLYFGHNYTDNNGYIDERAFDKLQDVFTELEHLEGEFCQCIPDAD